MLILFCAIVLFCGACTHSLAQQMVAAPNNRLGERQALPPGAAPATSDERRILLPVGPPNAQLALYVLEPKRLPARGTVLVLHGFVANHHFVRSAAEEFADAGFLAVMVESRGHGDSTGEYVTFGVQESLDLKQITDYLQKEKLAGPSVFVYGVSLGAATAIQYAAVDPRVKAVVAIAPFASLKTEAPHYGKVMIPVPGLFMSPADYDEVLRDAGQIASFDPAKAAPIDVIARINAPILLMHGEIDAVIPHEDSQALHNAAPKNSTLVILPGYGHMTACLDLSGEVPRRARTFFENSAQSRSIGTRTVPE